MVRKAVAQRSRLRVHGIKNERQPNPLKLGLPLGRRQGLNRFFELLGAVGSLKRGDNIAQQIAHQHTVVG